VLQEEPILEAANDVLIGDVGDGGAHLEEMPGVGPQGLVHPLLHLGQIMDRWKLLMKARLRSSLESMEFGLRL
jgi:hypothetical protein